MYLERVEPTEAPTIYALIRRHAMSCGIPIETMTFEQFKDSVFDMSFYFWWRDKDDCVALVNIGAMEPQSRKAEFGVISLRRRQGHAAAACYAILAYGFETLNLHRMYAQVNADNAPSVSLCEKHHMVRDGIVRHGRFKQGKYVDQIIFSVLESETAIWNPGEQKESEDGRGSSGGDGSASSLRGSVGTRQGEDDRQDSGEKPEGQPKIRFA